MAAAAEPIEGIYLVEPDRPLPGAGGGLFACVATDRRSGAVPLMAVRVSPEAPARPAMVHPVLAGRAGLLAPLAFGRSLGHSWVVCPAPNGAPLQLNAPWSESEIVAQVLRPASYALDALHAAGLTHRAIRPDNVFRLGPGHPVTLGCAWAAPPALHQPAVFEPPTSAVCDPSGRGAGTVADDVYALGVLMLSLALGRVPMAGLEPAEIVRRKLAHGCYAAMLGEQRLPSVLADLVRGMLAEDPEHRPLPALLADPNAAGARRVGTRPARRAQRPLELGGRPVWTARALAFEMAVAPAEGAALLRSGQVEIWLRRALIDPLVGARVEEARRLHRDGQPGEGRSAADQMLLMRVIALLDPLAPLCWGDVRLWPDGLGPLLAAEADPSRRAALDALIEHEAVVSWTACRRERDDLGLPVQQARQYRTMRRESGEIGLARVRYAANPLLACRSPLLAGAPVVRIAELVPALEALAAEDRRPRLPLDREVEAFIVARADERIATEAGRVPTGGTHEAVRQLRLLARLQPERIALPGLAGWLAAALAEAPPMRRSRSLRVELASRIGAAAERGDLPGMVAMLDEQEERRTDVEGAERAEDEVAAIAEAVQRLAEAASQTKDRARRLGRQTACISGLALSAGAALLALS